MEVARRFDALSPAHPPQAETGRYVGGELRRADDLEQTHMILGLPGIAYHDSDYYASQVLSTLLGGGLSSRLFQEVREKRGLAYSIASFVTSYADAGVFSVYAATAERDLPELIPLVCGEMTAVAEKVNEDEVRRAKRQIKAGLLMGRESVPGVSEGLGRHMLCYGRVRGVEELAEKIDAVSAEDISRVMRRLLTGGVPTLTSLGPAKKLEGYEKIRGRLN
jgi:predicted Zn-dependent peptidase